MQPETTAHPLIAAKVVYVLMAKVDTHARVMQATLDKIAAQLLTIAEEGIFAKTMAFVSAHS